VAIGLRPSRVHGSRAFAFVTGFGHISGIPLRNPLTLSIDQSQCQKPSTYNELPATLRYAILIAFDTNGISKKPCKRPTGHTHTHPHICDEDGHDLSASVQRWLDEMAHPKDPQFQ